jgi:hypothetical protein
MAAAEELVVVIGNDRLEAGGHSGVGAFTLPLAVAEWPKASAGGVRVLDRPRRNSRVSMHYVPYNGVCVHMSFLRDICIR